MAFMGIFIFLIGAMAGIIILTAFGIGAIVLGLGGVISSSFIKNKIVKRLLIITFLITIIVGAICASWLLLINVGYTASYFIALFTGITLISLGISGIRTSRSLESIVAKTLFRIVFFSAMIAGSLLFIPLVIYITSNYI